MRITARQTFFFYTCLLLKLRIYSQGNVVFDSVNVQINALNINSKEAEFGPFKIGNRFYYTSSRERRLGVINLDENTNHQMLDVYVGDLKDSVTVTNSQPLRNSINNSLNQGSSFFDKETSKLYYSGNIIADPKTGRYKLAIFSSEFKAGKFLEPRVELLLPDTFLASHPMIYDKKLYFSSNLKDGKGKADIYRAEQVNGRWGNITNLKELNSPDNDYFPFVINEKEIYFSSDRPGGFGRLDLYKYTLENDSATIQNLGKPINSAFDDYSAYVDSTQENGYFTTTRNSANQDDIYYFSKTWPSFNNCVDAIKESYCYDLKDEKSLETDSIKGYFYEWDFGDGQKQKGIAVTHCYTQPGTYVVNLNIIDVSTKAVFLNQTAIDLVVDSIVQLKINALDTILVNRKVTINTLGTYLPNKKITGYYFEIDNKRIRKESFEYTFAKTGKYRIKLGIEYDDLELNTKGLMCTNLDVHIVDSTSWVPFEDRKQEEVISNFEIHNIQAEKVVMADLDYDVELIHNEQLGLDKKKLSERIDDFLIVEEQHNHKKNSFFYDRSGNPANKNLGTDRNLLTELSEEAELTYRVHLGKSKTKMDTAVLNFKGIYGIKEEFIAGEYVYTYGNEAKPKDIEKLYQKALSAGIADVEVFGYKNNVIKMDDYVATQGGQNGFFGKNLGTDRNLLTELSEEAELTYRVHLGKSKAKMDTTVLNAKGLYGIKEEFIAGEYVYTYGNEAKPKDIDKYYKKALSAGIAEVEVFGYKNNAIKMDDYVAAQSGFFGKNLGTNRNLLTELSEEAELTYRVHLGKSKTKMDTTVLNAKGLYGIKEEFIAGEYVYTYGNEAKPKDIDKYYKKALSAGIAEVEVFGYKNNAIKMDDYLAEQGVKNGFFNKNLGTNRNLLTELSEEAELTYRVHLGKSKIKMDTTVLNAKGLYGIKEEFIAGEYVYTYGNEAKPKDIDKYYKKALSAGLAEVDVFGYKNNAIKMDDYVAAQGGQNGFFGKNLGTDRNLLTELSEEAELTYRVHLGKSKTKMDTTVLNAKGLYGIKEEFIAGEYVYTYGNEAKPKDIDKYYKKALSAGLAEVDVFGYKNNAIKMDEYLAGENPQKSFFNKNLSATKTGLSDLNEDLDVSFRVHLGRSKNKMDTAVLHAKGIYGIKEELIAGEYVYTYGNEAKAKDIEKYYNKALQAGIKPEVFAYKKDAIVMDPYLAAVQRDHASDKNGGNYQNLGAIKHTLLDLSENAEIDFKVYLGKSKTKRDTTFLAKHGMKNIREEFKDGNYYYTFGEESKLANIEKYYKIAAKAGIKDPVIIAYKNEAMIPNQINSQKLASFGEEQSDPEFLADVSPKKPKDTPKKNVSEDEEIHKAMKVAMASAEKALESTGVVDKTFEKEFNKEDPAPVAKTDESVDVSVKSPEMGNGPKPPENEPKENKDDKLSPAIRPDDVKLKDAPLVDVATEETLDRFIEKYGDASAADLEFRVQISAFKYRNRYEFPHLENLGKIENTLTEGGITRITIGGIFDTYKKAMAHNKKVIAAGQKDAFVTIFYQGKRVYPENLERMGIFLTK